MKGLLIKDFGLLKRQKRFFQVVIVIAVAMAFFMKDSSFILGYLTFIIPSFALSTISYDEFDNGNAFLFTLPISRPVYVIEKYCFTMILGALSLVSAIALAFLVGTVNGQMMPMQELLMAAFGIFTAMFVMQIVMLPLQLKFGSEKGRVAMFIVVGVAVAIGYGIVRILEMCEINVSSLLAKLQEVSVGLLIAIVICIVLSVLLVSMKVSIAIIEKKEF